MKRVREAGKAVSKEVMALRRMKPMTRSEVD